MREADWGFKGERVSGTLALYVEGEDDPVKYMRYTNARHRKQYIDRWSKEVARLPKKYYIQITVEKAKQHDLHSEPI